MNLPRNFEEYVREGIIRKCSIDRNRAKFLISESQKSLIGLNERVETMGINENNANSIIKDCYDVIMEMIRAKMLLIGYSSAGQFAHEGEVSYLKKAGFPDSEVSFLNDLRYFRNSVTYYGKILTTEYAKQAVDFTRKVSPRLKKMVE